MLFHVALTEADRERLGVPADRSLVYDPKIWKVSEATALYKSAGMTRQSMNEALKAKDPEGKKAITWLALRRAGVQVRYSELDFDLLGWALFGEREEGDPEPEDDEKDGDGEAGDEGNSGAPATGGQTPQP